MHGHSEITYWCPRDPHQLRSIIIFDWKYVSHNWDLYVFRRGDDHLLWVWGAAAAVQVRFNAQISYSYCFRWHSIALVALNEGGSNTLYCIPLRSEREEDYLPPPALPEPTRVEAIEIYRGIESPTVVPIAGSDRHAPLVELAAGLFSLTEA